MSSDYYSANYSRQIKPSNKPPSQRNQRIAEFYKAGWKMKDIAAFFEITPSRISVILRAMQIPIREKIPQKCATCDEGRKNNCAHCPGCIKKIRNGKMCSRGHVFKSPEDFFNWGDGKEIRCKKCFEAVAMDLCDCGEKKHKRSKTCKSCYLKSCAEKRGSKEKTA